LKNRLKLIISIIGITFIISIIISGFFIFNREGPVVIERQDNVNIDYTVWESNNNRDYNPLTPILDTELWITMIPITENETTGLILGLYNNLLGKQLYYESGLLWLDRCIDQDRDGIDDITGDPALTFGNSSDLYFDTCLMIEFKVLDIQKASINQEVGDDPFVQAMDNFIQLVLVPLIPFLIVVLIVLGSFFLIRYAVIVGKREFSKVILKFGILISVVSCIPFIVWGIINLTVPSSQLNLLITTYDFFLPVVIFLIVITCIAFTVVYLLLYKAIERKRNFSNP
jgi:hypothetical protein